jgi:hypothetical protein
VHQAVSIKNAAQGWSSSVAMLESKRRSRTTLVRRPGDRGGVRRAAQCCPVTPRSLAPCFRRFRQGGWGPREIGRAGQDPAFPLRQFLSGFQKLFLAPCSPFLKTPQEFAGRGLGVRWRGTRLQITPPPAAGGVNRLYVREGLAGLPQRVSYGAIHPPGGRPCRSRKR